MRLREFESGTTWDTVAAAQQLCILLALYKDQPDNVEALVGTDAELVWYRDYGAWTWPPAWCIIRQGDDYFVTLAGTTSLRQMFGHLWGSFGAIQSPSNPMKFASFPRRGIPNGAWAALWKTLWPEMREKLPASLSGKRLLFCGHSYGGAVAQLFCNHWLRDEGVNAQLMTFGSPRVWTYGFEGELPRVCYLISSYHDPVFVSPPSLFWGEMALVNGAHTFQGVGYAQWRHYGHCVYLRPDGAPSGIDGTEKTTGFKLGQTLADAELDLALSGELRGVYANSDWRGHDLVSYDLLSQHTTANYFGRVLQRHFWRAENGAD